MSGSLDPRDRLVAQLRYAVTDDPWMARYALGWCCEELSLEQLADLWRAVDAVRVSEPYSELNRYRALLAERFGR